ncbi:M12 family metallo-peptidase [Flavilitoribacter nigricans]|uniref:Peptidase M12B domain-containing protein n=1 Tax=Flavilitoribacter nigricans (strain ATCC 23147 / DSM 23189 / NBRC 102662 / NCIMB 1420 / SS-2) TaxID=1122177 RepID=A0A2D0NJ45_FLAN2|nr:M12 family metallo-peptidase [Flavilitoribacter nigricans]PHN08219.1 hypothetical protein CRP01_02540 [Flavilitoribacter nigricans DSM 23189 = NBRC 102662]
MNNCKIVLFLLAVCVAVFRPAGDLLAQPTTLSIAKSIATKEAALTRAPVTPLLTEVPAPEEVKQKQAGNLRSASYLRMDQTAVTTLLERPEEVLKLRLPNPVGESINLRLERADIFSDNFNVYAASDRSRPLDYQGGAYYWGIVDGHPESLAAITVIDGEVSGLVHLEGSTFNLGRMEGKKDGLHVFYRAEDLQQTPPSNCFTDDDEHNIGRGKHDDSVTAYTKAADNCVRMYVEVDYDIYQSRGGVTQAADYVTAVFNQVSILYANEAINLVLNEVVVWDVVDPYTGTSTSNYLTQFRNNLNGEYNGDLAHLVGYNGGGGIAYLNVLCNSFYGVGYSDINSTFNEVPTYSWTIEVVTHEIGHNLGSSHTHACVWNGDNTAIDGCGPAAGYSEGCNGPIPSKGTIMSYCHLVGGVGIDLALGFGPQPGDLIRSRVYNSSCLIACGAPTVNDAGITSIITPSGTICTETVTPTVELSNFGTDNLTSVTINYEVDGSPAGSFNWTGNLAIGNSTQVNLPDIAFAEGGHFFSAYTTSPNGVQDEDTTNDAASSNFTRSTRTSYYADADGDGFGDPNVTVLDCVPPAGYVTDNTDCNDNDANAYPGAPCNDGESCTTGDIMDANCNCAGTFTDSDGDGVCDGDDICPGGDDSLDSDSDGIPDFCDCNPAVGDFPANPLVHDGTGATGTTFTFEAGSKDAAFTISGLDRELSGNPRGRYAELVTITYIDGGGNTQNYGTFDGGSNGTVVVSISDGIQSVTVELSDGYDGSAPVTLSVNLSAIDYCVPFPSCLDSDGDGICDTEDVCPGLDDSLIGMPCDDGDPCTIDDVYGPDCNCTGVYADSDNDTVCDGEDVCPGGDDRIDSDGDGIPDACDPSNCSNEVTSTFSPNPLSYSGTGSASSTLNFSGTHSGINFTISDLSARTGGKPDLRFIEEVTVTYVDATDTTVPYGTFSGETQSTVNVSIPEVVKSITVTLRNAYGGASSTVLSIDLSTVVSCASFPRNLLLPGNAPDQSELKLYPNPTTGQSLLRFGLTLEEARVIVRNLQGAQVASYEIQEQDALLLNTQAWSGQSQVYLITIYLPSGDTMTKRLIVARD